MSPMPPSRDKSPAPKPAARSPGWLRWPLRVLAWLIGLGAAAALAAVLVVGVGLAMAGRVAPSMRLSGIS